MRLWSAGEFDLHPLHGPGLELARQVYAQMREFVEQYGQAPRVIYLQNHGLIALGQSTRR